jgi:hypothetical protein
MARQIIVLDRLPNAGGIAQYNVAFWLGVIAARQTFFANAQATSQVKGITAGELTALQNGSVVERVEQYGVDPAKTIAQIQADLVARKNVLQADLDATNQFARYGTSFDGTTWTNGGA